MTFLSSITSNSVAGGAGPWFVGLYISADGQTVSRWKDSFQVNKANLADTGQNMYFILEPGCCLQFTNGGTTLTITVLSETKAVDGVTTRVVEEREEKNGQPVEISRNFFALDKTTLDVYYFGEEVDIYKNGKVVSHEGAWLSGAGGAKFGLMMPGRPDFYRLPHRLMDTKEKNL